MLAAALTLPLVARGQAGALLTLEEALGPAAQPLGAPALALGLARPGRELALPDCAHLAPAAAAALLVRLRFFETILADLRYEALNEHMAMAFGRSERAKAPGSNLASAARDTLELRYLELRARRDAMTTERRVARLWLAQALGTPQRVVAEAHEPALEEQTTGAPVPARAAAALARVGAAQREALRLAIEQTAFEIEQRQTSGRALARKRMDAAFARVDEARARLESEGRGAEFGDAMAASVGARADYLANEYQLVLSRAWLEATLGM